MAGREETTKCSAGERSLNRRKKTQMPITVSRYLAIVIGILTPLAETIRRWNTWKENLPAFFDDYIIGAFLLFGAWRAGKDAQAGRPFLAAAWAFMCGMAYVSFFSQLEDSRLGVADPAPIPSAWVAAIKGLGLAIGITCLILSLWPVSSLRRGGAPS